MKREALSKRNGGKGIPSIDSFNYILFLIERATYYIYLILVLLEIPKMVHWAWLVGLQLFFTFLVSRSHLTIDDFFIIVCKDLDKNYFHSKHSEFVSLFLLNFIIIIIIIIIYNFVKKMKKFYVK